MKLNVLYIILKCYILSSRESHYTKSLSFKTLWTLLLLIFLIPIIAHVKFNVYALHSYREVIVSAFGTYRLYLLLHFHQLFCRLL